MTDSNSAKEHEKLPHMGQILKKYCQEKRIYKAAWSRHQGVRKETITSYFKKPTMQIATLFTICQVLNYNFFRAIANALPVDMPPAEANPMQQELDNAHKEIEKLKLKIEVLEEMMDRNRQ
jgi:hypothetical protein